MHSPEIRQKFIELRADAHSIPKIASLLGVAQSTLRLWEKDDALEIAHLRCSYWEDAEDKVGITIEHRLRRMAAWVKGAEDELEKRHFDLMNNRDLMRFLREARREYFRLRAMLFNAPGAKTRGRDAAPSASALPLSNLKSEISNSQVTPPASPPSCTTASAVSLCEPATDKIDKIGELADFSENQPRNTNDLQQPKSSPADFPEPLALVADEVTSQVTSPDAPANPQPSSAYAAQAPELTVTSQPIQHAAGVPHLCGTQSQAPQPTLEPPIIPLVNSPKKGKIYQLHSSSE